jgi:hypothetical protein
MKEGIVKFLTHITGKQGRMHIRTGEAISAYETADGVAESLPFTVSLDEFNLEYYKGTSAPMDYISHISIQDGEKISEAVVSMNNIHKYRGYRFYQSGFDRDGNGATLAVSYDPWGIGITYAGYIALLVSMMGEANPRITQLMPVLLSPLLSVHVMVIMISYTLFAFIMLNGVAALISRNEGRMEYLKTVSNIMLYPASDFMKRE